jgi:hypothetical protein
VNRIILCPSPDCLSKEPQQSTTSNDPQKSESVVRHNRRNKAIRENPGSNKLGDAVSPYIFVDRRADQKFLIFVRLELELEFEGERTPAMGL